MCKDVQVCKDATIKTQMLFGFDPAENETVSIKPWRLRCNSKRNGQKYLLE